MDFSIKNTIKKSAKLKDLYPSIKKFWNMSHFILILVPGNLKESEIKKKICISPPNNVYSQICKYFYPYQKFLKLYFTFHSLCI